jgi:hypothetical protein
MGYGSEATRWSTEYATAGSDGKPLGATLTVTPATPVLASDPLITATTQTLVSYSPNWAFGYWDPATGRVGDTSVVVVGPNGCAAASGGGPRVMVYYKTGSFPNNQWAQAEVGAGSPITAYLGPALRISTANGGSGFWAVITPNGAWGVLYALNGSTEKGLPGGYRPPGSITVTPRDVIKLSMTGNVITLQQNGTTLYSATVPAAAQVITSGSPGIYVHGGLFGLKNWSAGAN